jgi:hypothetical protein
MKNDRNVPTDATQVHFLKADLSAGRPEISIGPVAVIVAQDEKSATAESVAICNSHKRVHTTENSDALW